MSTKKTKNILFTFDYELSLGYRSGTVMNCMIKPTQLISEMLKTYRLKAVFFIDTTSIIRMKEESERHPELKNDIELIRKQIVLLHAEGHYIFHHIHPHWLDAVYLTDEKQWDLSNQKRFSVDALSETQTDDLIRQSKQILEGWIQPNDSAYTPEGYRAGGLFIQPFEKFYSSFQKYQIRYDFSVLRDAVCELSGASYDFSISPNQCIYNFEKEILKPEENGQFTQFSIELVENSGLFKILNGIWFRLFYKNDAFADGKSNSVIIESKGKQNLMSKFSNSETISFELANPAKNLLYKKHVQEKEYTHFISHPKLVGPSNLKAMEKLLKQWTELYTLESDFKNMLRNK